MELGKLSALALKPEERDRAVRDVLGRIGEEPDLKDELESLECPEEVLFKSYPVLLGVYEDRTVCRGCLSYASCPKKGREGSISKWKYLPYLHQLDTVSGECPKLAAVKETYRHFAYCSLPLFDLYKTSAEVIDYFRKIGRTKKTYPEHSFAYVGKEAFLSYAAILSGKKDKGLYLSCENALGEKLFRGLAFYYAKNGKRTAYADIGKVLKQADSLDKSLSKEARNLLERLESVPVLFLTRLGDEYPSNRLLTEILLPFLKGRLGKGKVTYVSSAFDTDGYADRFKSPYKTRDELEKTLNALCEEKSIVDVEW